MNSNGWSKVFIPTMVGLMGLLIGLAIAPTTEKIELNRNRTEENRVMILEVKSTVETELARRLEYEVYVKNTLAEIKADVKEIKGK